MPLYADIMLLYAMLLTPCLRRAMLMALPDVAILRQRRRHAACYAALILMLTLRC